MQHEIYAGLRDNYKPLFKRAYSPRAFTPHDVIKRAVCAYYDITTHQIESPTRKRVIVQPRQIAMLLMKQETRLTLKMIGQQLGNRDHSSVSYGCKNAEDLIETDKRIKRQFDEIKALINAEKK